MILKNNFDPIKIYGYISYEFWYAVGWASMAYLAYKLDIFRVYLPFSVAGLLGSALAIFIAFRNNSSYSRWWEGRTLWGGKVNASRVFARLIVTFTDSHSHQAHYEKEKSEAFKRELILGQIAWVHALRLELRGQEDWNLLRPYLAEADFEKLKSCHNRPNFIQLLMGRNIYKAMANGTLGGFDSFQLEGQLLALANLQGSCERLKDTPLLKQYDYFTRVFLYIFIGLLPFCLIGDFAKLHLPGLTIPASLLLSLVFAVMSKVGKANEDPFENKITDVPITALSNQIERDLLAILGTERLPEKIIPEKGYLY